MEPTGSGHDEITEAALEAVTEAGQIAAAEVAAPGEEPAAPLTGRLIPRARRAKGIRRLGGAMSDAARRGARATSRNANAGGRWLSGRVLAMAPRLPVRDLAALRVQFPGKSPDELASALIDGASRASAAVGAAVGAWAVLPVVPAMGAEIATETLAVVGIEIKLAAELHEAYGMRAPGNLAERMSAYVGSWARRRGISVAPGGLVVAAGSPLARLLRRRLAARAGRSAFSLGPLLTGAAAGAVINRHETRKLGRLIADDLRQRSPHPDRWPGELGR